MTENVQEEQEQQEQQPAEEAADDGAQQKLLERFEKMLRLMDSDTDNEAENAFRKARALLPDIGLSFGGLLDLIEAGQAGAEAEELRELVGQYEQANEQLKLAEDVLLQENDRLNLLLRNFRDAKVMSTGLNVGKVKKSVKKAVAAFGDSINKLEKIDLPATPEDLETRYRLLVAESINVGDGVPGDGPWQKWLFWNLKVCGRNMSDEAVVKLQDLVASMDAKLADQAELHKSIEELKVRGAELCERLDLIIAQSAPKPLYDKAMEQLRDLQLAFGEGQDIASQKKRVATLEAETKSLSKLIVSLENEKSDLAEQLGNMQREIDAGNYYYVGDMKKKSTSSFFADEIFDSLTGGARSKKAEAAAEAARETVNSRLSELSRENKELKRQAAVRDAEITRLANDNLVRQTNTLVSPQDQRLVQALEQLPLVLTETERRLEKQIQQIRDDFNNASAGKNGWWSRIKSAVSLSRIFGKRASKQHREARKTLASLESTLKRLGEAKGAAARITTDFETKTTKTRDDAVADWERFRKTLG